MARLAASAAPRPALALLAALLLGPVRAFLPYQNPTWEPTWNMSLSTITMACNSSGWFNLTVGAAFGITSYDWSNAKAQWAAARPMNAEEMLAQQAQMTKAANPDTRVFVYRNLVKALPWFSSVRKKLDDPAYSGFFLKFAATPPFPNGSYHVPRCDDNYDPPLCPLFNAYHDQEQTPQVPSPSDPNPDGSCNITCDSGLNPTGEYVFDHRNGSMLRDFLIHEHLFDNETGLGNENISGLMLDDTWCGVMVNGSGVCDDPVQGPTEMDPHNQVDMGLSDQDIADLTWGWLETFTAAQAAIVAAGKYTWSLIPGQANANAQPVLVGPDSASCLSFLREACRPTSQWQSVPLLHGLAPGNATNPLPTLTSDIAVFLLARGDYAWTGYGVWGMSWPAGTTWQTKSGTPVARPEEMDLNYGSPSPPGSTCTETAPGKSGVFTRTLTNVVVTLDCATYAANYTWRT